MHSSRETLHSVLLKRPAQRRVALLIGGALVGLVIAGTDLITQESSAAGKLPTGAIAQVGGRLITQPEFERVALDLANDKRTPAVGDRNFALQRIIEEELLVQRGVELGFPETAPWIRKELAAAVITQVVADAEARVPSSKELQIFYDGDTTFFTQPERWRVRWLRSTKQNVATASMRDARAVLFSTCEIVSSEESTAFEVVHELPNMLLPLTKLMDYMGPTLARRATRLQPGECSEPVLVDDAYHVLYLKAHQAGQLPDFEVIRDVVEAEYIRRAGEKALRDYLTWLRNRAEITIDEAKLN